MGENVISWGSAKLAWSKEPIDLSVLGEPIVIDDLSSELSLGKTEETPRVFKLDNPVEYSFTMELDPKQKRQLRRLFRGRFSRRVKKAIKQALFGKPITAFKSAYIRRQLIKQANNITIRPKWQQQ